MIKLPLNLTLFLFYVNHDLGGAKSRKLIFLDMSIIDVAVIRLAAATIKFFPSYHLSVLIEGVHGSHRLATTRGVNRTYYWFLLFLLLSCSSLTALEFWLQIYLLLILVASLKDVIHQ